MRSGLLTIIVDTCSLKDMRSQHLDRSFYSGFFFGLLAGVIGALHAAGVILAGSVPSNFGILANDLTWIFGWIGVMVSVADASSRSRLISARVDGFIVGFGTFIATYGLLTRIPLIAF